MFSLSKGLQCKRFRFLIFTDKFNSLHGYYMNDLLFEITKHLIFNIITFKVTTTDMFMKGIKSVHSSQKMVGSKHMQPKVLVTLPKNL